MGLDLVVSTHVVWSVVDLFHRIFSGALMGSCCNTRRCFIARHDTSIEHSKSVAS